MGLDDPTAKMSKSTKRPCHAVGILDPPDTVMAVMRRAVTDSGREIAFSDDPAKAGVTNLLTIYQALSGHSRQTIDTLRPTQQRYKAFMDDPATLDDMLRTGAEAARQRAAPMLDTVKERVGFPYL